jgi:hypothetical protein
MRTRNEVVTTIKRKVLRYAYVDVTHVVVTKEPLFCTPPPRDSVVKLLALAMGAKALALAETPKASVNTNARKADFCIIY